MPEFRLRSGHIALTLGSVSILFKISFSTFGQFSFGVAGCFSLGLYLMKDISTTTLV